MVILLSVIHYREVIPGVSFIKEIVSDLGLDLTRHTLERIIFIIPVAYVTARLNVRGGVITLIIVAIILSPRAFLFSPEPKVALLETGGIIFTGALLVSLVYSLQKRKEQTVELEMTNRMLSETRQLQEEVLRRNSELLTLNNITRVLCQSLDLEIVMHSAAEAMLNALEAEVSWVQLTDDTNGAPTTCINNGVSAEAVDKLMENVRSLASSRKTDTSTDCFTLSNDSSGNYDKTSWYSAITPLKSEGVVMGIAGVVTRRFPFDRQHIQLIDTIGIQITGAIKRCRLYAEAQLARDVRGELLRQVITTQEEERKRIARRLHDETCQSLTTLGLGIEGLMLASTPNAEDIREQLLQYHRLCHQIEGEVDNLILDLRPTLLDDLGLVEAIRFYTDVRFRSTGIDATVKVIGKEGRLLSEIEAIIFRVTQECITNIIKHANAVNMVIELQYDTNRLILRIEDDGRGFEVSKPMNPYNPRRGMGLLGIKERIGLLGGSLNITSKPGSGTLIEIAVPMARGELKDK